MKVTSRIKSINAWPSQIISIVELACATAIKTDDQLAHFIKVDDKFATQAIGWRLKADYSLTLLVKIKTDY